MKICFFGLGSIGKRHLNNIYKVTREKNISLEVHAFRSKNKSLGMDKIDKEIFDKGLIEDDYDVVFVTNPTYKHYETIKYMENNTKNMFIEKPIFENTKYNLTDIDFGDGVYYIAAPLRFTGVIKKINSILEEKEVYSIRAISSSYLPDWRPNRDYRKIYSAKKEEGGGVSIDLIHEWDYLIELFGFPEKVVNFQGKYSHLEINSEDLSIYIAEYYDKLLELHLDYFGRVPKREIEIYTEKDIIVGDFINDEILFKNSGDKINISSNNMYVEEMRYFLETILDDKKNPNPPKHAYNVLNLIEESRNNEFINNNMR